MRWMGCREPRAAFNPSFLLFPFRFMFSKVSLWGRPHLPMPLSGFFFSLRRVDACDGTSAGCRPSFVEHLFHLRYVYATLFERASAVDSCWVFLHSLSPRLAW